MPSQGCFDACRGRSKALSGTAFRGTEKIAHVFARSGYDVVLCDVQQSFLERALGTIAKNLDREVAKNKITAADKDSAMVRIQPVTERSRLADCDFVIEVATEKFETKTEI